MIKLRERRRAAFGLTAAALAAALALTGCGSDGADDSGSSMAGDAPAGAPQAGDANAGAADRAGAGAEGKAGVGAEDKAGAAPAKYEADARSIIYNGSITVRVDNPDMAAQRAVAVATGSGGFVGSDRRTSDGNRSQATLELRVPAERFETVVTDLARLGHEESRSINTEDVTEQVVDLDARIATQQVSVNRTRALLARANTIAEIVSVEGELSKREAELSSLQARKRRLADLTSLSTITLVLLGPEAAVPHDDDPDTGFVAGLKGGWKAFVASLEVLLTVLGALLPWFVALGIPVYGLVWLLRRSGRRRGGRPTPVGAPPSAAATLLGTAPAGTTSAGTTSAGTGPGAGAAVGGAPAAGGGMPQVPPAAKAPPAG